MSGIDDVFYNLLLFNNNAGKIHWDFPRINSVFGSYLVRPCFC
jgi:hypothetical protein